MHRILSVGQCGYDHGSISRRFRSSLGAEVIGAETADEAFAALRESPFDLVLVNRVFDADGFRGLDLIRAIKADPEVARAPVMLVSNFADAQREAEAAGALPGFGKAEIDSPTVRSRLSVVLQGSPAAPKAT